MSTPIRYVTLYSAVTYAYQLKVNYELAPTLSRPYAPALQQLAPTNVKCFMSKSLCYAIAPLRERLRLILYLERYFAVKAPYSAATLRSIAFATPYTLA